MIALLSALGISKGYCRCVALLDRLAAGPLPYVDIWDALRPLREVRHWRRKMDTLAKVDGYADGMDETAIAVLLYRRIRQDQTFSAEDLLPAPDLG